MVQMPFIQRTLPYLGVKRGKGNEIWAGYTLEEVKKLYRVREFIKELQVAKEAHEARIVIFSEWTFLSEWALMVHPHLFLPSDSLGTQADEYEYGLCRRTE